LISTKKQKSSPTTRHEDAWRERRYSSYSFLTTTLDGVEWSASLSSRALAPEKGTLVPIVQEAGWAPEPVWTQRLEEKSFRLCQGSNLDRPVVQPVARYYTDWATRLTERCVKRRKSKRSEISSSHDGECEMTAVWDMAAWGLVEVKLSFRDAYNLNHQGDRSDEDSAHLWNVGLLLRDKKAQNPWRLSPSKDYKITESIGIPSPA
jgi:hypothetical protein